MERRWVAVSRGNALAIALSALSFVAGPASSQQSSAPPPMPAAAPSAPAAQKPATPRASIQLAPAEKQAIDAAQAAREKPAPVEDALAPGPEDAKPRAADDRSTTRIEQTHVSNRVSEVIVTPAGQSRSYVMTNREGQQPFGATQMSSGGLSVPMFLRFEFGRSTVPPATTTTPPPQSSSPLR